MREVATLRRRLASMVYESLLLIGVLAAGLIVPHLLLAWLAGAAIPGVWLWLHLFLLMGALFHLVLAPWRANIANANVEN